MAATRRQRVLSAAQADFARNVEIHTSEKEESAQLGYGRIRSLPAYPWAPPPVRSYGVPPSATGMGPVCPFALAADPRARSLPLVFESEAPLFTAEECQMVVDEAREHIASGRAGTSFTYADTSRGMGVADLPRSLAWLNAVGMPRVAALAGACYGEAAIGDPRRLVLYRALVVQYDAAAGLTHQPVHRDHSLVTCVVTLNERREYTGGGTWLEDLGAALAPPRGHAMLQASALRHSGHFIDSGERWVMVLFFTSDELRRDETAM